MASRGPDKIIPELDGEELEGFWATVDRGSDEHCWPWLGRRTPYGYGQLTISGKGHNLYAHRLAYTVSRGQIPEGMVIDHLCRLRTCCNPAHLEPVSIGENVRRGAQAMTHCKRGHEFTSENLKKERGRGRECRECDLERKREAWRNRKEAS